MSINPSGLHMAWRYPGEEGIDPQDKEQDWGNGYDLTSIPTQKMSDLMAAMAGATT